jgi:hypothetical protein
VHVQQPDPVRDVVDRQVAAAVRSHAGGTYFKESEPFGGNALNRVLYPPPLPGSARYFFLGATNRGCFGRGARSSKRVMRVTTSDRILLATMVLAAAALRASVTN